MASQPDNTRQHEAETAALLALSLKRRYSLPSLIAQAHIRPRPFRRIQPTNALKHDLASPYYDIIRGFQAGTPALMSAYSSGSADAIDRAVARVATGIDPIVATASARFPRIAETIERWHRNAWVQRVKTATGLDVSMFTASSDVAPAVETAVAWNRQLAADVAQQVKHRAATELVAGSAGSAPEREIEAKIADIVRKAKRRAAGIGDDQCVKAVAAMTRSRGEAAGLAEWMWQHNTEIHFRPEHKARNRRIFTAATAPPDLPATLPFCRCDQIWLLQ